MSCAMTPGSWVTFIAGAAALIMTVHVGEMGIDLIAQVKHPVVTNTTKPIIKALQAKQIELEKTNSELEQKNSELEKWLEKSRSETIGLQSQLDIKTRKIDDLKQKSDQQTKTINSLNRKIKKLTGSSPVELPKIPTITDCDISQILKTLNRIEIPKSCEMSGNGEPANCDLSKLIKLPDGCAIMSVRRNGQGEIDQIAIK